GPANFLLTRIWLGPPITGGEQGDTCDGRSRCPRPARADYLDPSLPQNRSYLTLHGPPTRDAHRAGAGQHRPGQPRPRTPPGSPKEVLNPQVRLAHRSPAWQRTGRSSG